MIRKHLSDMTDPVDDFTARFPDAKYIDAFIFDMCGKPLGKRYRVSEAGKLFRSGLNMCAAVTLLDATGNTSDPLGYGVSDGDPDALCWPLPGTLAPIPWASSPSAQVMVEMRHPETGDPVWFEPRQVLKRVLDRFAAANLTPVVATELEFYLIDKTRGDDGSPLPVPSPRDGRPVKSKTVYGMETLDEFGRVLEAIGDACVAQNIPATVASSEFAPGQFEINLKHQSNALIAADHAGLLKRCITAVAREQGYDATFASKPFAGESGSGLHLHLSILDHDGRNIFDDPEDTTLKRALAGLQETMADSMAIFAPNLNAFRRFQPDLFVPVTKDWGYDNRAAAFRIPPARGQDRRIEHRVAGADANPYLAAACVLTGALHGLTQRDLPVTDPAAGNVSATPDPTLPLTLWQALDRLHDAPVLAHYLGPDYLAIYRTVKTNEFLDLMSNPLPHEFDWYL